MHTLKIALASSLAMLVLSTAIVQAGSFPTDTARPITGGDGPVDEPDHKDHDNANDDTGNGAPEQPVGRPRQSIFDLFKMHDLTLDPYSVNCSYWGTHTKYGPVVGFFNKGTKTIPKGSIVTLTFPDGTTAQIKVTEDITPGNGIAIDGPAYADQPGFTCTAKVTLNP